MTEDNTQVNGVALGRWTVFAMLLIGSLVAYFWLSPRVAPTVRPPAVQEPP